MILSWDVGIYNLSYCILDIEEKEDICGNKDKSIIIKKWGILDIANREKIKKNKMNVFENMPTILDTIPELLDVKYVIIENQPSMKNPTMKTIQIILYSYFLINGMKNNDSPIEKIVFQSPMNKLKVYKGPPIECKLKSKYSQRKFSGKKCSTLRYRKC